MIKRILSLLAVLAGITGLVYGVKLLPWEASVSIDSTVGFHSLDVKAKDLTLVCPGSAFSPSKASAGAPSFNRIGTATVDYANNLPTGVVLKTRPLTGPAAGTATLADSGNQVQALTTVSATAVTVSGLANSALQGSGLLTAQSFEVANSAGIIGALGANCQNPTAEAWLVGGVTTVGRQSLLVIANPSATDATVAVQLFGTQGQISGSGLSAISVSANRTVVLPLAGFAPEQSALAVHVVSAGASVATWIQQSTTRGTVSAGADLISPSILPSTQLALPGLLQRGSGDAASLVTANGDYSDLAPSLHVFVAGLKPATVTVQVVGSDAKSTGTVRQEQVPAASAASIDLTGLSDGNFTVFVASDQPVIAQLRLSRTNKTQTPVTDYAWLPAVAPTPDDVTLTAPKSAISKLSIANNGTQAASVQITDKSTGESKQIVVGRLSSQVVSVTPGDVVSVSADHPVAATMICDFGGQIVAIPGINQRNIGGKLYVQVR